MKTISSNTSKVSKKKEQYNSNKLLAITIGKQLIVPKSKKQEGLPQITCRIIGMPDKQCLWELLQFDNPILMHVKQGQFQLN